MSFLFTPNAPFKWPVTILLPNAGGHKEIKITGLFEMIGDTEFLGDTAGITTSSEAVDFEIERICAVFKGWMPGDVQLEGGAEFSPTEENIRKLLGIRPVRLAVLAAYSDAITPSSGYRAKN